MAAYPITSHFDVKRAYNAQTGEELNIVEENTTDRPWYQRDYFRVDWSTNQVDTPQWSDMFIGQAFGDIKLTPVSYYVSDPDQDDAPHFDPSTGYFDVTSKFLVEPVSSNSVVANITGQNISTYCLIVLGALRSDNNNIALVQGTNTQLCAEWAKALGAP